MQIRVLYHAVKVITALFSPRQQLCNYLSRRNNYNYSVSKAVVYIYMGHYIHRYTYLANSM
jgi:hypothetical protein